MKILVVDDIEQNRLTLERFLKREKHHTLFAENGRQAIERFITEKPDLILMDIMMPVMNGIDATVEIRHLNTDKWVPILIVSAINSEESIVKGLQAGADDYLLKPINPAILYAKLASIKRSIDLQSKILDANKQLRAYRAHNEIEQQFVQRIFDHLIDYKGLQDKQLDYWLLPARRFSGDLICVKRIDTERLYFMLADSTGHGLAAALPTIIINQVFRRMTQKHLWVGHIAREINQRLKSELPIGHFAALTLGMIDNNNRRIEIWNGGLPDQWLLNTQGHPVRIFHSRHTFAGILGDEEFDESTDIHQWQEEGELFLYSDGITEIKVDETLVFDSEQLLDLLKNSQPGKRIRALQDQLKIHLEKNEMQDDISCLCIRCR